MQIGAGSGFIGGPLDRWRVGIYVLKWDRVFNYFIFDNHQAQSLRSGLFEIKKNKTIHVTRIISRHSSNSLNFPFN